MKNNEFFRFRRLRQNPVIRKMIQETTISVNNLIYPMFVTFGNNIKNPVSSMPGIYQLSIDKLKEECKTIVDLGIPAVLLFGIPERKDLTGSDAFSDDGIIQQAIRVLKKEYPQLLVITDLCLCEYTSHGHCGLVKDEKILNDESLAIYQKIALAQAKAGTDMIAPSDMMDGRVLAIRDILDRNDFCDIPIMSYSAKYASALYGPFREAAQGAPKFGDRKSHQMDIANSNEAIREIEQDIIEGTDIIMVKPAGFYLDIIYRAKQTFQMPLAAYQVSGEYSMIKAATSMGWLDEEKIIIESLTAIRRAGADLIITYFAPQIAKFL